MVDRRILKDFPYGELISGKRGTWCPPSASKMSKQDMNVLDIDVISLEDLTSNQSLGRQELDSAL